jgi:hypothetical protein
VCISWELVENIVLYIRPLAAIFCKAGDEFTQSEIERAARVALDKRRQTEKRLEIEKVLHCWIRKVYRHGIDCDSFCDAMAKVDPYFLYSSRSSRRATYYETRKRAMQWHVRQGKSRKEVAQMFRVCPPTVSKLTT